MISAKIKAVIGTPIFFLLCLCPLKITAQEVTALSRQEIGRRFVQNYGPDVYYTRPQNRDIIQDQRGLIYVANGGGVLEYDGETWRSIPMSNYGMIYCLALDAQNRLYVGGSGEMGHLSPDSSGALTFHSLVSILPDSLQNFSNVRGVDVSKGSVYFRTSDHIFQVDIATLSLTKVWTSPGLIVSQLVGEDMYMWRQGLDWGKVSGDSLIRFGGGIEHRDKFPGFMPYPIDSQEIHITLLRGGEKLIFDGENFHPFPLDKEVIAFLDQFPIAECNYLGDGKYFLILEPTGGIIINQQGELLELIDDESGLENIDIFEGFVDRNQDLWLASNFGLSKMESFTPFSFLGEEEKLEGSVYGIIRHKGELYVGTSLGAYRMILSEQISHGPAFQQIMGLPTAWSFCSDGDQLLVGGANKIYQIKDGQARSIVEGINHAYWLSRSPSDSTILYAGFAEGLAVMKKQLGRWKWVGTVNGVSGLVRSIIETEPGTLWLGTDVNGIFRVILSQEVREGLGLGQADTQIAADITQYTEQQGIPKGFANVIFLAERPVILTTKGLKRFDPERQGFVPETAFGEQMADTNMLVWRMEESLNGRITALNDNLKNEQGRNLAASLIPDEKGGYSYELREMNRLPVPIMAPLALLYPDPDQPDILWMGGSNGLIRYDMSKEKSLTTQFPVYVREITTTSDSVIYHGNTQPQFPLKIRFEANSLRFDYAAVVFQSEDENSYQIFLEGNDKGWSDWSYETYSVYTNLSEGMYSFRIRGRNVAHNISESIPFAFEILPPWYRSWWAYLLYSILLIGCVGIIVRLYSQWRVRQLTSRNQELEQTVEERTVEIREALDALKMTQNQLILKEKMASLGQLTVGIAHEIKNPLNFVKNFAEGAEELLTEFEEDWKSYQESKDPEELKDLEETLGGIRRNHQIIIQNGDRADQIVNGMMKHANDNLGKKSQVNINQLVKEQMTLALHGFKSAENPLAIAIDKDLAKDLPPLLLQPQKLERVMINLVSNACYALVQKKESVEGKFVPTIQVRTSQVDDQIRISVRDNGTGIPEEIRSKIFQPFFTTKPTGKGNTGLGLSISYDIITKGLQGTIELDSKEGEFTEFVLSIPASKNQ